MVIYFVPCKLGYGYNSQFKWVINFDTEPKGEVTKEEIDEVMIVLCGSLDGNNDDDNSEDEDDYENDTDTDDDTNEIEGTSFGDWEFYQEEGFSNMCAFAADNENGNNWRFMMHVCTRREKCKEFEKYPENADRHVTELFYGMVLMAYVEPQNFPDGEKEKRRLLKTASDDINTLSEDQKKTKCRVLINMKEVKEMTMEEIVKLKNVFKKGEQLELETVIFAKTKKHKDILRIEVTMEDKLDRFLNYLSKCYMRIKVKLKAVGYPVFEEERTEERSLIKMITDLNTAQTNFKEHVIGQDKPSFLKPYPSIRELCQKYVDYLGFCIDNNLNIDVGQYLPCEPEYLEQLLTKIDNWYPVRINNEWFETEDGKLLIIPTQITFSTDKTTSIEEEIKIEKSDTVTEPYFYSHDEIDGYFGFVKMKEPFEEEMQQEMSAHLEIGCSLKCSDDVRKWICTNCGDIIKQGGLYLSCSCGIKLFEKEMLECNHPEHELTSLSTKLPEDLRVIVQQLKKYQKEEISDPEANQEIEETRRRIIREHQNADVKEMIEKLMRLNIFDGDTEHVLKEFLGES